MNCDFLFHILIPFVVSLVVSIWFFPRVLHIALKKNFVDVPDERKLQKRPVPVIGGVAVMLGIFVSIGISSAFYLSDDFLIIALSMFAMLCVGTIDDLANLSPLVRLMVEALVVLLLIYACDIGIDSFHGLWGIYLLPRYVAIPLSLLAVVGIANAINLIDGVDGYSSGFCMLACIAWAAFFYLQGNISMVILASACVAALIPFFFHNVFGVTSKMFIGDGGTLLMGSVMGVFVLNAFSTSTKMVCLNSFPLGFVAFALAVLSIPVFDTLRVMMLRISRGSSPFKPDKEHLHHLFIDMGFSHIGTTLSILSLNVLIVLVCFISCLCGASVDMQLYIVIFLAALFTFGLYGLMRRQEKRNGRLWQMMQRWGRFTHVEHKKGFLCLQRWMDGKK